MARRLVLGLLLGVLLLAGADGRLARELRADLDPDTLLALGPQLPFAKPDPTGASGAGGCSVAHHAGGARVGTGTRPPCARLYRTGVTAFETTLGIDADGTVFFNGLTEDAVGNGHSQVLRSTYGGRSWQLVTPLIAGQDAHGTTEDPYLYLDPRTSRVFDDDLVEPCHMLSFTDDGGETWTNDPPVGCGWNSDHQTVFAGPPPAGGAQPQGYPDVVYLCSIAAVASVASFTANCSKSLDGGRTFVPTGEPAFVPDPSRAGDAGIPGACQGTTGHGFVGPDGTVYVPKGLCGQPFLAISHDEGATWTRVQVASNGMNCCYAGLFYDHEAGVAADPDGNVYYAWVAADRLPYLAVSRDGGATWGPPLEIGIPGLRESVLPALALGAPGKVAIAYLGSTNSPWDGTAAQGDYASATWNEYVTETTDALDADPLFTSVSVNDPADPLVRGECGPIRCQTEGEFINVQIGLDGTAWTSASDGCNFSTCSGLGEGVAGHLVGGKSLR